MRHVLWILGGFTVITIAAIIIAAMIVGVGPLVCEFVCTDPKALQDDARRSLPIGSSLIEVTEFLKKRKLEFSFDSKSTTVYAIARHVRGSGMFITRSFTFKFHFDDQMGLKFIDTEPVYTGP
jgi:hypothetical protein